MNERQKEIYEDIIKRRGPENPLTKSQKKHLKKVAKKRQKSEIRREAQEEHRRTSKKVIRENRGVPEYTPEFTQEAAERYLQGIQGVSGGTQEEILWHVRSMKPRILELVLRWAGERDWKYSFYKGLLETYWDHEEKLQEYIKGNLGTSGGII